jgi:hypothetical protein
MVGVDKPDGSRTSAPNLRRGRGLQPPAQRFRLGSSIRRTACRHAVVRLRSTADPTPASDSVWPNLTAIAPRTLTASGAFRTTGAPRDVINVNLT